MKSGTAAYDEQFHRGVNVIRSDGNSRGKSTIMDLIFFSLGGDLTSWKNEAAACDYTLAEVSVSGATLTLRREIKSTAERLPMQIFFGSADSASSANSSQWSQYAYQRYGDRESFSQVLFRALGMPEVPADDANITMHQILRLMYVDQMTSVNRIFRFEARDAPLRRQAVGDLLCGVLDERIYPAQIRERSLNAEYATATTKLTGLLQVLRAVDEKLDFSDLLSRARATEQDRSATIETIQALRAERHTPADSSTENSEVLNALRADLAGIGLEVRKAEDALNQTKLAVEDASLLLHEIERSLQQIRQARRTGDALGNLTFAFCPSCFSPLEAADDEHSCHLCKQKLEPDQDRSRYARMQNELEVQLKESLSLQALRLENQRELDDRLTKLRRMRDLVSQEYNSISLNFSTETDARIDALTRRVGYLDRELVDIDRERRMAEEVAQLSASKEALAEQLRTLRRNIDVWMEARLARQNRAYRIVAKATAEILRSDTKNDIGNVEDSGVYFNFTEDRVEINGKSSYSASSLTVIRNAFHVALLAASCWDKDFLYPRFVLLDNIEDKGMTPERSHKFQETIIDVSKSLSCEHQIIFSTSMPSAAADQPSFAVGAKYDENNMSLRVG
ncbi:hypothetical protein [Devosia sp. CAU 1758]